MPQMKVQCGCAAGRRGMSDDQGVKEFSSSGAGGVCPLSFNCLPQQDSLSFTEG